MSKELIFNEIESKREEYINFLRELIQINSYNPPGNEVNVALKIENYLNQVGIKSEIFLFGNNRANLIAYSNDIKENKVLLYNAHMDVVPPGVEEEWDEPPLSASVKRKKIMYGRGATDMKGGLAAMVIALKLLKKHADTLKLSGTLIVNAVAEEETGGHLGTEWCLENKLKNIKCDFCIVGEPSGLNPLPKAIILGEKGHLQLKIITNGKSAHASTPFLGKNAIYMMSDIIQRLEKLEVIIPAVDPPMSEEKIKELISASFPSREIFERIYNEQQLLQNVVKALTKFTKSLTMIKGGIKENVVPDRCEAVIDFRTLPGQESENIINAVKSIVSELGFEIRNTSIGSPEDIFVSFEIIHQAEASLWKEWEDSKILPLFSKNIEEIYKKKPFYFLFPACSDAHYYRNNGYCPATIIFGPGSAASAHSTNEFIEIEDFINSIKVYAAFACEFLK